MRARRYQGILFDLGGTLFEHQQAASALENLLHAARAIGIEGDPEALQQVYRTVRHQVEARFAARKFYLHRELVAESIAGFAAAFDRPATAGWVNDFCDRQRDTVVRTLELRVDTLNTLTALRQRGLYLAIVSNIDEDYLAPLLERTDLRAYFDHCTSSEAAGSCKPDSGFFQRALALGGLQPAEALYVGDSLRHDVVGASRLGMDVAWLASASTERPEDVPEAGRPTYVIQSLNELVTRV